MNRLPAIVAGRTFVGVRRVMAVCKIPAVKAPPVFLSVAAP